MTAPVEAAPAAPPRAASRGFGAGLGAVLVVSALAYAPTLVNGVTNWDDDAYVLANPWFGEHSLAAFPSMFTSFYKANYHPLTWVSHMLDVQRPPAFHKDRARQRRQPLSWPLSSGAG